MTDPNPTATIARLRELIKAAGEWPDLEPEDQSDGSFRCPLCDGQGEIEAEHVKDGRREYGNDSWFSLVGVQVYGVGDAMASMEALLPLLIKHTPALLDQLAAQAAEVERVKFEREALVNAAICGQRSLHSEMINRWGDLRDAVLHGLDGLDNDQTNEVLGCIDDHFPSDINPAVAEESSDTENRADRAEARVAELTAAIAVARAEFGKIWPNGSACEHRHAAAGFKALEVADG